MSETKQQTAFERVYSTRDPAAFEEAYDDWADSYDSDLKGAGYATPGRVAAMLAEFLPSLDTPVLDFACGSGLSGRALRSAGLTTVDGVDVSQKMLDVAARSGAYRRLTKIAHDDTLPAQYGAIAAVGAISRGAAPPEALDTVVNALESGGLLALSFNDHTLGDEAYTGKLASVVESGALEKIAEQHGPHLPKLNLGATLYILKRQTTA